MQSAWQVNTDLQPLDLDEVKEVAAGEQPKKMTKALWSAYQTAAEGHDREYYKSMLVDHEQSRVEEENRLIEEQAAKEAKQQAKEAKVTKTKTKDQDAETEDAPPSEKKSAKKR